jgi:phospholipase/carboxylesterase
MRRPHRGVTRRTFLAAGGGVMSAGCIASTMGPGPDAALGRLRARPRTPGASEAPPPGQHALGVSTGRDGLVLVPKDLPPKAPLVVLLHGATGSAQGMTRRIASTGIPERFGAIILAPDSRQRTWDAIRGSYGPDVTFLDAALTWTFERFSIDTRHLVIGGFSDGATYGLSLGLINGDLFTHVMAFSPGFLVPGDPNGKPAIFVSHGTNDEILPIDRTSRRLVPQLRKAGYAIDYHEFDGPHTVPAPMVEAAFEWMRGAK